MRRAGWIVAAGVVVLGLLAGTAWWRRAAIYERTYRIGFENDPPFHFPDAQGQPTGLVVDVINEAARRSGLRLAWSFQPGSSDQALLSGRMDLWPLMTIRPERRGKVHITEPYRESEVCLIVRAESPARELGDFAGQVIAHNGQPLATRVLKAEVPDARQVAIADTRELVAAVCQGQADAAYMDEFSAVSALMNGASCPGVRLRVINVLHLRGQMGIGATFASARAADVLRDAVADMAEAGEFGALLGRWSYFTGRSMELNTALLQSRRTTRVMLGATAASLTLLLLMTWMALWLRQQRDRAVRAEQAQRLSEARYASLFTNMNEALAIHELVRDDDRRTVNYRILDVNPGFEALSARPRDQVVGRLGTDVYGTASPPHLAEFAGADASGQPVRFDTYFGPWDRHLTVSVAPMGTGLIAAIFADMTASKRAEDARARLEEHLQQAQRMESIGRLAGGVAHDFNNLLTVINGYSDMLLTDPAVPEAHRPDLQQIREAGAQAASLTQQLLAFSRKQAVQPRLLNLNAVVKDIRDMVQRLVGEDIALTTSLDPAPARVMADAGQIHQVIMNLVVNARDAMPRGGRLSIETRSAQLSATEVASDPELTPGVYVVLAVSDTGIGMDPATRQHIFEPFFTTKGKGEGTGLGLAIVYGIVRQNRGWIHCDSVPGQGSTFSLYLPAADPAEPGTDGVEVAPGQMRGTETILLVEDQANVRQLAATVLRGCGYRILEAGDAEAALAVAGNRDLRIDLLLTDVILPGLTGKDLADRLQDLLPGLTVLFMSGYTEDVIAHRGVINPGLHYLPKPFTPRGLAEKVRKVLDLTPQ